MAIAHAISFQERIPLALLNQDPNVYGSSPGTYFLDNGPFNMGYLRMPLGSNSLGFRLPLNSTDHVTWGCWTRRVGAGDGTSTSASLWRVGNGAESFRFTPRSDLLFMPHIRVYYQDTLILEAPSPDHHFGVWNHWEWEIERLPLSDEVRLALRIDTKEQFNITVSQTTSAPFEYVDLNASFGSTSSTRDVDLASLLVDDAGISHGACTISTTRPIGQGALSEWATTDFEAINNSEPDLETSISGNTGQNVTYQMESATPPSVEKDSLPVAFSPTGTGRYGAIQTYTVETTGTHTLEAIGAAGGQSLDAAGGLGARMSGKFELIAGQTLNMLVGQRGGDTTVGSRGGGGGGATYIWIDGETDPLIVAGGGGGAGNYALVGNVHANITTDGSAGTLSGAGAGGTGGNGGARGTYPGGGAGWVTDGEDGFSPTEGGHTPLNGGDGGASYGTNIGAGGFGGGGGAYAGGGGGGGYSGGGGGGWSASGEGGGGGSYNVGTDQDNETLAGTDDGSATITPPSFDDTSILYAGLSVLGELPDNRVLGIMRRDGVNYFSADIPMRTAPGLAQALWATDPAHATPASWSLEDINNSEFGLRMEE